MGGSDLLPPPLVAPAHVEFSPEFGLDLVPHLERSFPVLDT